MGYIHCAYLATARPDYKYISKSKMLNPSSDKTGQYSKLASVEWSHRGVGGGYKTEGGGGREV